MLAAAAALSVACGSDATAPAAPLPVTATVSLAPGQSAILGDTLVAGAVRFPAAPVAGATYLVVGQFASGVADVTSGFALAGQASVTGTPALPAPAAHQGPAEAFHAMLRQREAAFAREAWRFAPLLTAPSRATAPPSVGTKRSFRVCANLDCSTLNNIASTAQFVGTHLAVFVDDSAPAGGFNSADLTQLGQMFDGVLYPIDTDRFGAESDIDGNGVVIVLLTPQINALVGKPACNTSFITGFFFGADIAPGFAAQYNNGEVFYGMVPDPNGKVSCVYTKSYVQALIPVTFIHEFQHMISYNQHALLRGGISEALWLNEGLSHLAEELGGLHYDSLHTSAADTTAAWFLLGDLGNAYDYLRNPSLAPLVTEQPPGSLESRGAAWLFLRYVVDQAGPAITRALVQTSVIGAANIEQAAGAPFATLLARAALAVYLTDVPGFTAPPELAFASWRFRFTFASMHQQDPGDFPLAFPLQPATGAGGAASVSGTMASGASTYLLVGQVSNGPAFDLTFRGANAAALPAAGGAQLAIVRLR